MVAGGAGYVGSIVAEELLNQGYEVLVLDNLRQGHREAVPRRARFLFADICDPVSLNEVFGSHSIDCVVHMVAETVVEYSLTDPGRYFQNNLVGGINLLNVMIDKGVKRLIFSSSAAVYGEPRKLPIREDHPKNPINAYGESKLAFERILESYKRAYGLKYISLRYFNAAGASRDLGEDHHPETHLIPNILKVALGQAGHVNIFGTDYPTRDGSCIRDYIHVLDIARAHILAISALENNEKDRVYNLGNGEGYSVLEVIEAARKVTGADIPAVIHPRRQGDPAVLVANSALAKRELRWQPTHSSLENIIETAWQWQKNHPKGYAN